MKTGPIKQDPQKIFEKLLKNLKPGKITQVRPHLLKIDSKKIFEGILQDLKTGKTAAVVPQLKVDCNGKIELDVEKIAIQQDVINKRMGKQLGSRKLWKYSTNSKWSEKDVVRFYFLISQLGRDFQKIEKYFTDKCEKQLKNKYKKEWKLRRSFLYKLVYESEKCDDSEKLSAILEQFDQSYDKYVVLICKGYKSCNLPIEYKKIIKCPNKENPEEPTSGSSKTDVKLLEEADEK